MEFVHQSENGMASGCLLHRREQRRCVRGNRADQKRAGVQRRAGVDLGKLVLERAISARFEEA